MQANKVRQKRRLRRQPRRRRRKAMLYECPKFDYHPFEFWPVADIAFAKVWEIDPVQSYEVWRIDDECYSR